MRSKLLWVLAVIIGVVGLQSAPTGALSSDPKQFISADNTFYSYVKGGETLSAAFLRVDQDEPFDTVRGEVTVTIDGPGIDQKKCVIPRSVAIGDGCRFESIEAPKTGIWRVQFATPADAKTYYEVSPTVKWAKNLFSWNITVKNGATEQKGRTWTERYAIRQPTPASYIDDFVNYYISEDGYIYKATSRGYHGQISTLSADSVGIRSGTDCVSVYHSTDVSDNKFSPALGTCGNGYKLFFEEPSGDLPTSAEKWDKSTDWIRPNISKPSISGLKFQADDSNDQQSGTIVFSLKNFVGQYQIKIDVDNDGGFDGQDDVVLNRQMKKLSTGEQKMRFDGTDKNGRIIARDAKIGIKVEITKVAEIHLVAADVEGRTGGIELTRLSGENAPTTRICWNDTELGEMAAGLMTKTADGRDCPDSVGGVHGWSYADVSWGNARYIDDWIYASAKLVGQNQITYPDEEAVAAVKRRTDPTLLIITAVAIIAILAIVIFIITKRRRKNAPALTSLPPEQPPYTPNYKDDGPNPPNQTY